MRDSCDRWVQSLFGVPSSGLLSLLIFSQVTPRDHPHPVLDSELKRSQWGCETTHPAFSNQENVQSLLFLCTPKLYCLVAGGKNPQGETSPEALLSHYMSNLAVLTFLIKSTDLTHDVPTCIKIPRIFEYLGARLWRTWKSNRWTLAGDTQLGINLLG